MFSFVRIVNKIYVVNIIFTMFCTTCCAKAIINGVNDGTMLVAMKSVLISDDKDICNNLDEVLIDIVAQKDIASMKEICKSYGYFDCSVTHSFKNGVMHFNVCLGVRYVVSEIKPVYICGTDKMSCSDDLLKISGLKKNKSTDAKSISVAMDNIRDFFIADGYIRTVVNASGLVIDKVNKSFCILCNINTDNKLCIRKTNINVVGDYTKGIQRFVENRLLWRDGDVVSSAKIDETRELLLKSGMFSGVDIAIKDVSENLVDIDIVVTQIKRRTIGIGAQYGSNTGIGVGAKFCCRNIDGRGSVLILGGTYSSRSKTQEVCYNVPDVFGKKQEVKNVFRISHEKLKAYKAHNIFCQSVVSQYVNALFSVSGGCGYERSKLLRSGDENATYTGFRLAHVIFEGDIDLTDSKNNPTRGTKYRASLMQFLCKSQFTIAKLGVSCFIPIASHKNDVDVIACSVRMGKIFGRGCKNVPVDKLFYGGGFGSVRGYGYQMIGKLDDNNKPVGGCCLFEYSCEFRWRSSESVGLVFFVDGGIVNKDNKMLSGRLYTGYGFGLRLYTVLSPICFDIAFPCKRRKDKNDKFIDSSFVFYVSVGHAF